MPPPNEAEDELLPYLTKVSMEISVKAAGESCVEVKKEADLCFYLGIEEDEVEEKSLKLSQFDPEATDGELGESEVLDNHESKPSIGAAAAVVKYSKDWALSSKLSIDIDAQKDYQKLVSDDYYVIKKMGDGGHGVVVAAVNKTTGCLVAIKIQERSKENRKEAEILQLLDHPSITHFISYEVLDAYSIIVMELAISGSLQDIIEDEKKDIKEMEIKRITTGLLRGLAYLESMSVVWLDMKPDNILMKNGQPILADFGLSMRYEELNKEQVAVGTPGFAAPEVAVHGRPHVRSDIFSLGATIVTMIKRLRPDQRKIQTKGFADLNIHIYMESEGLNDFLIQCLEINPNNRPSAEELLDHFWLK